MPLKQHGRSDAYATIVVYDGPHACTAAVLGRILRRLDPSRPRAALVHRVSNATKAMLTADDLWELHHMRKPFPLPQSALWPRKPVIWGFQAQLWSLKQFRRVLFFDADHIPLPELAPSRLAGLWDGLGEGQLGAAPEGWRAGSRACCDTSVHHRTCGSTSCRGADSCCRCRRG